MRKKLTRFTKKKFPINYDDYIKYINATSKYGYPKLNEFLSDHFINNKLKVKKFIKVTPNIRI